MIVVNVTIAWSGALLADIPLFFTWERDRQAARRAHEQPFYTCGDTVVARVKRVFALIVVFATVMCSSALLPFVDAKDFISLIASPVT